MRHFHFYLILACLAASCGRLETAEPVPAKNISIIDDRTYQTDSVTVRPDANLVLTIFDFEHNQEQAASVTYRFITDTKLNVEMQRYLPDGQQAQSDDPHFREKVILAFYKDVHHVIDTMGKLYPPATSFPKSEVFYTLCGELSRLSVKPGQSTILAYTDLGENALLSCYNPETKKEIYKHPEKIADSLNKLFSMPGDCSNVEVHVFYRPHNRNDDDDFQANLVVFRILMTKHKVHVYVHTTNDITSFTNSIQ